jgi:hypothetical protein
MLLAPAMGYTQLDTTLTYRQKGVHHLSISADTTTISCKIDTIKYAVDFEIKFNKTKKTIAIDGYGTYKYVGYTPTQSLLAHSYQLENGGEICWVNGSVIWASTLVKRKATTIIFEIKKR